MIWIIRLILIAIIAILNWLRGWGKAPFLKRPECMILMSVIMGLYWAIYLHIWWLFPLVGGPMYGCLSLGDKNRGVWCSLVALGTSFFLLLTGNLAWYWFGLYCGGNYLIGWYTNNKLMLPQLWEDLVTGIGFGLLLLI